jgi:L-arabinose isomerase
LADLQSFEVADGDQFGDLLSKERIRSGDKVRIGLLAGAFFEYWRMYPGTLKEKIEKDARVVLDRLTSKYEIVCPGLVDSVDSADEAGRVFLDGQIDLLIIAERSYVPDTYIHQVLSYIPSVPILLFISQSRDEFDLKTDYEDTLRNSGMMSTIQLAAGFKKMGIKNNFEVVVGSIHDEEAFAEIERYIDVVTIHKRLRSMTIGVVGHVFRGMFDFEFDKTMVKGMLGPEVLNVQIGHLIDIWESIQLQDPQLLGLIDEVYSTYRVEGCEKKDVISAARTALSLERLVDRFRLDGLVLLGQHFIEAKTKSTSYLGMVRLAAVGKTLGVTEGDVLGLIMMKIMHHFTGLIPFFSEWSEFDVKRNAMLLLGHGFADPAQAKSGTVPKVTPTPEQWGIEGSGFSFEMTFDPGPVTFGHFIRDDRGWRMLISGGEIIDMPTMPIHDVSMPVKVSRPIKEYVETLTKEGFAHHCIAVRGDIKKELSQLADLLGMEKVYI